MKRFHIFLSVYQIRDLNILLHDPIVRTLSFEPRASPDDSDDSSDDDGGNLEGDDYQYNGGGYEDYEYAYYTPRQEYD